MLVRDVMTRKVITLSPDDRFEKIIKLLVRKKISGAPVVNSRGKVVGVVSEKDLFFKLFPSQNMFYKDPEYFSSFDRIEKEDVKVLRLRAKQLMTKKVISISSDDHILKACSLFIRKKIRRLPVIDNGILVGILTANGIYKRFLAHITRE